MRNPFVRRHPFGEEDLSAYLDSRLSPTDSAHLQEHLLSCEPCRRQLDQLRAVVEGLRALPTVPAPRSFALRSEHVGAPSRPVAWAFGPAGAAAASFLLLLVLVGVDLGTLGNGGGPEEVAMPLAAEQAAEGEPSMLGAAPEPTPALGMEQPTPGVATPPPPALVPRAYVDEEKETDIPDAATDADALEEAPAPMESAGGTEEGDEGGRWVLRGFQAAAGAVLLVALATLVWQRRSLRAGGRT